MYALIVNRKNNQVWTGDEWANRNQQGVLSASKWTDHGLAAMELEQHADDDEFADAEVVDVDEE